MEPLFVRPRVYARLMGIDYRTVLKRYHAGEIDGVMSESGRVLVRNPLAGDGAVAGGAGPGNRAVLYARVSGASNKASIEGQLERLRRYAAARGYVVVREVREVASGLSDDRRRLNSVLDSRDWDVLLVEHRDRLTRFGYRYIERLLPASGRRVESINTTDSRDRELMDDLISIITSFCGRIYGSKRKERTRRIIAEVEAGNEATPVPPGSVSGDVGVTGGETKQ